MRKNFGVKPWMYPQPVLIIAAYGKDGTPCAMNAAWGGTADSDKVFLCLSHTHKTVENILSRGAFTIHMADAAHVVQADYVGIVSGNTVKDKLDQAGLHTSKSAFVDAPLIDEFAMAMECKLLSYDQDSEIMIGEVVNVCADESVLDADGKIDTDKLAPITFDAVHHTYRVVGNKVGDAFKDGNKLK